MPTVKVNSTLYTQNYTSVNHFGTNFLPGANSGETPFGGNLGNALGNPTIQSENALEQFGVSRLRFPGGQAEELFAKSGMIVNGDLPDFLKEFLTFASQNAIKVSMVVPVEDFTDLGGLSASQLYLQLETLSRLIAEQFPNVVDSYELGNEYWRFRTPGDETAEVDYGKGAAHAAMAIQRGSGLGGHDPVILLQTSGNFGGAYSNDTALGNAAIQEAFSSIAGSGGIIDGVIRNFYWKDASIGGFDNDSGIFSEDQNLEVNLTGGSLDSWERWAGHDLLRYVGEYNINRNLALDEEGLDLGVHGASILLEHYTNLVDAHIDYAYVWPVLHSTINSLVNRHEAIQVAEVHGMTIVVNSTRAAMFDLLRQTAESHELVELGWTIDGSNSIELTAFSEVAQFGSNSPLEVDKVVFLSSRSPMAQTFDIDLTEFLSSYTSIYGISVYFEEAGGHSRNAIVAEMNTSFLDGDGTFTISLRPYEVIELVFSVPNFFILDSTTGLSFADDQVLGAATNNLISTYGGNDTITSYGGSDSIDAGSGHDLVQSGSGRDTVFAGGGDDTILSQDDNDIVYGGNGDDFIDGGSGNDSLYGGEGDDIIAGFLGDDLIFGANGIDFLLGDDGNDSIYGGAMNDTIFGGAGNDVLDGGAGDDELSGSTGHDSICGAWGDDTILGGYGNDLLKGGDGDDAIVGGFGNDNIDGGRGMDLLTGGMGADIFYFNSFDGSRDTITDFNLLEDSLQFGSGSGLGDFHSAMLQSWESGASTLVELYMEGSDSSVASVLFQGIPLHQLSSVWLYDH